MQQALGDLMKARTGRACVRAWVRACVRACVRVRWEYPACHKEKPYPKHPIDSDSLLPLPPAAPPAIIADQQRHACGAAFEDALYAFEDRLRLDTGAIKTPTIVQLKRKGIAAKKKERDRRQAPQPFYRAGAATPQPFYRARAATPQPFYRAGAATPQPFYRAGAATPQPFYPCSAGPCVCVR
jgi:hypothetical protein